MSAAEETTVNCSQESETDSSGQCSHSDASKDTTGPPSTAEESNDLTANASSSTSRKCDSQQDLENSDKKSLDSAGISKTKREKTKVRNVQSRYMAAAASKSSNNSSGNGSSTSNSSGQGNLWANETVTAGPPSVVKMLPPKTKPKRARPEDIGKSRAAAPSGQPTATTPVVPQFQAPQRSATRSVTKTKTAKPGITKPSKSVSRSILHSTTLNTTLMDDVTNVKNSNMLSSTLLGGITPGGFKQTPAAAALMELPDISVIKPEGNNSGNRTILSSVGEEQQADCSGTTKLPEITAEMLEQEYMRYLQWAYVDVSSELAFAAQLKEMQNQIVFLEELVADKQQEVSELKQKTELFVHHQRVGKAFETQTKLLQALIDDLPGCEEAEKTMERELEKKLHQVKMENIYVPQDHIKYREELTEALNSQISVLQELEGLMEPRTQNDKATIKLLSELQDITELVQRCEKETQQAAGVAVEDASHQLGAKPIILDAEFAK